MLVDGEWRAVGTAQASAVTAWSTWSTAGRRAAGVATGSGWPASTPSVNGPEGQSTFVLHADDAADERGGVAGECRAPLPGAVTKVLVAVGDVVAEGDGLVVLEAMKMEHTLRANGAGTVAQVHCAPGQQVDVDDLLVDGGAGMTTPEVLRVGNCSGFFGDRAHAAREMVEGGPLDVLTGDWLAELTMYILHKTRERSGGYARTFLRELEEVLPTCIERGITVVSNAGGLHPEGLAAAVRELARRQGLDVHVASVSGDDITPRLAALQAQGEKFVNLDTGEPLPADAPLVTANAYLRARPIADALAAGAQVVVTGRVTDAALVVGPALHAFGWSDADLDAIAGAVVAGHVIECGAQCCGGNYAFFEEVPAPGPHRLPPRRAAGGRLVRHHQAPGDGRHGHGRDGDGAAPLRDRRPALPQPRRRASLRHHSSCRRRDPTGCASRRSAARRRRPR